MVFKCKCSFKKIKELTKTYPNGYLSIKFLYDFFVYYPRYFFIGITESAGAFEYTDCIPTEG